MKNEKPPSGMPGGGFLFASGRSPDAERDLAQAESPVQTPMMDAELKRASFWIAAFAGIVSVASILFDAVRPIVFPVTILAGGTAVLLFVRMLFSRTYRQGVYAVNREAQGNDPWPGRARKFRDPEWGLFGSRAGSPALLWLRAVFILGPLPIGLLQNWLDPEVLWLWIAGAFVAMELSVMHAALSKPR
ncbi:hypothetical protein P1X14_16780 [Sphingomonas sp. AOB5]|uniref:hypothetical protein n=1 Tax=Sphingomonas sp. AOB5 TaxID=3034017 RepID=UPI0023F8AC96|nr:hypothetical protein [Sphingomonas sp. AOB5]MDF7776915.1 hypothetical protein [Sphingomonas sp. AOB5]